VSPASRPMRARARGAEMAMRPSLMSPSWSPTMLYTVSSPDSVSARRTVAPNTTREPESLPGSMTSASAMVPSSSRMRPSRKLWRSFAA